MTAEKARGLSVKVDVDVTEALTGLKAIQREAKEATKALRELEAATTLDFSEGSVIHYLAQKTGISPDILSKSSLQEIVFMYASLWADHGKPRNFTATIRSCDTDEVIAELLGELRRDGV